jgi:integrase
MASVHKQKQSRFWYGHFRLNGRLIGRSTGETDKARALAVAMAWEEAAKGRRVETENQARKVMEELLSGKLGREIERVTCGSYLERWLASIDGTVAASTLAFYRGAAGAFVGFLGPDRLLDGVGPEDVVAWRSAEAGRVSAVTANNRLKAVRAMFESALRERHVRSNPAGAIKALKRTADEERKRRPFSREEIGRVLAAADGDWRLMVQLGLQTGQRLGDLVRLDWRELDLGKGVWMLRAGKTGRRLLIPLSGELVEELRARGPRSDGGVFPGLVDEVGRSGGYVGGISKKFAHILYLAGLRSHSPYGEDRRRKKSGEEDRREQQELSFHSLRHTARTWLEESGQPKAVIDALVGHSGDMGRTYTTVGIDALRAAAAVLAVPAEAGTGTGGGALPVGPEATT